MLKYLLVVLSESSTPFCYYENKPAKKSDRSLIPIEALRAAVLFALKNNLKVNFLYPGFALGRAYDAAVEAVDHVKIVPFERRGAYPEAILVIEPDGFPGAGDLKTIRDENIILRSRKSDLSKLAARLGLLLPRSKRINVVWTDLESFGPEDFEAYRRQLEIVSRTLQKRSARKAPPELNILTDRLALAKMNNCDAGLTHLTLAPNGKLYLCPAFYYADAGDTLGEIRNEIPIGNRRLLELKYAPICRMCDAYHCKRCVFLNKKLTLEINTPSFQQCRVSHLEREASRLFLKKIKDGGADISGWVEIPEIPYDDPFEVAEKAKPSIADFKKM